MFCFFKPTCAQDAGQTGKHAENQGTAGTAGREKTDKGVEFKDTHDSVPHHRVIRRATCVLLTATISALEIVGAMLLMNREQVLWRGLGLGASSLGFFSSFFTSSAFSFGFSSSSLDK